MLSPQSSSSHPAPQNEIEESNPIFPSDNSPFLEQDEHLCELNSSSICGELTIESRVTKPENVRRKPQESTSVQTEASASTIGNRFERLDGTDFDCRGVETSFLSNQAQKKLKDDYKKDEKILKRQSVVLQSSLSGTIRPECFISVSEENAADNKLDSFDNDPWGLSSYTPTCVDRKFTSLESECSPASDRKIKTDQVKKSMTINEYVNPRVAVESLHNLAINSSTSKSSTDSTYCFRSKRDCGSSNRRRHRLIRWQPINSDESISASSDSPIESSSDSDSDSLSQAYVSTKTPNHSLEDTPDLTAYHTPKLSLSSASDSDDLVYVDSRNRKYYARTKSKKRLRSCKTATKGDYTKLDTGSSEILGNTEGNTTATVITVTDNTTTQTEALPLEATNLPTPSCEEQDTNPKKRPSRVDSFLSTSSTGCDAYQRVSPGGTPWTVWYRAQSQECTDVPPLVRTDTDTLQRMKRRLTEIPRWDNFNIGYIYSLRCVA